MRRFLHKTLQLALESVDLVAAGVPIPAILTARALSSAAPILHSLGSRR